MGRWGSMISAVALAGCAAPEPTAEDHAQELATCRSAVAEHVGKPVEAVRVSWVGITPEKRGLARADDDDPRGLNGVRVHLCEFDGSGGIAAIRHFNEL